LLLLPGGWPCYGRAATFAMPTRRWGGTRACDFGANRCVAVHPSDSVPALIALDAKFVLRTPKGERIVNAEDYFVGPEIDITRLNILQPGDLLVAIRIPGAWADAKSISRRCATGTSGTSLDERGFRNGAVGEQHRAHPHRGKCRGPPSHAAASGLKIAVRGKPADASTGEMAGRLAVQGAVPLQFNAYKVSLMRNLVKRAIGGVQEAQWAS